MLRNTCLSYCCCPSIKLFTVLSVLLTVVVLLFLCIFGKVLDFTFFFLWSLHVLEVIYSMFFSEKVAFDFRLILF